MKSVSVLAIAGVLLATVLGACSRPAAIDVRAEQLAIQSVYDKGCAGFAAGDMEATMSPYSKDLFLFDLAPPHKSGFERLEMVNTGLRAAMATVPTCTYEEMTIEVVGADVAYAHYILPFSATMKDGTKFAVDGRGTDVLRKLEGTWKIVHEHFSVPVDPLTGKAELLRAP